MTEYTDPTERQEVLADAAPLPDFGPDDPAWQTYTYRDGDVTISVDDGVLAIDPHGDTGLGADLPTGLAERVAMARAILAGSEATVVEPGDRAAPATSHVPDASGSASDRPDWARLALALVRGEEPADVDPDDPGAWEVACASLYGDQGRMARLTAERDQARAEASDFAFLLRQSYAAIHRLRTAWTSARRGRTFWREAEALHRAHRARAEDERHHAQQTAQQLRRELHDARWGALAPHVDRVRGVDTADSAEPYPQTDGDHRILGPEVIADAQGDVISWQGVNYARQSDSPEPGGEVPDLAQLADRLSVVERALPLAAALSDLRTVEDAADDRARRTEERLAALENRMLAVELGEQPSEQSSEQPADAEESVRAAVEEQIVSDVAALRRAGHITTEYRYCGAHVSRDAPPSSTCNRRIGHDGQCSTDRDA